MDEERVSLEDLGIGRLFGHVRDGIVVANARSERIVAWNACAAALFGYSEGEALRLPLEALVPENLRMLHRTGIGRFQQTGSGNLIDSGNPVELVGLHKEGHEVPIELTLTAIPDDEPGVDRYVLAIVRDISDRKAAEISALKLRDAKLKQQQALELNDTIVQGLAVAKMALESGRTDKGLEAVTETLKRVKGLVADLLADISGEEALQAGDLVRSDAASIRSEDQL